MLLTSIWSKGGILGKQTEPSPGMTGVYILLIYIFTQGGSFKNFYMYLYFLFASSRSLITFKMIIMSV